MEFTTEKAQEIVQKFGLDPKTIKVWKTRKSIPDKYADPDFSPRADPTPKQKKDYERLLNALLSEKIYKINLCKQEGIKITRYQSAIRKDAKRVDLTMSEAVKLRRNLNELRIEIKKIVEPLAGKTRFFETDKKNLGKLFLDERLNARSILGAGQCYDRLIARNSPSQSTEIFEDWEAVQMVDALSVFLLETSN